VYPPRSIAAFSRLLVSSTDNAWGHVVIGGHLWKTDGPALGSVSRLRVRLSRRPRPALLVQDDPASGSEMKLKPCGPGAGDRGSMRLSAP